MELGNGNVHFGLSTLPFQHYQHIQQQLHQQGLSSHSRSHSFSHHPSSVSIPHPPSSAAVNPQQSLQPPTNYAIVPSQHSGLSWQQQQQLGHHRHRSFGDASFLEDQANAQHGRLHAGHARTYSEGGARVRGASHRGRVVAPNPISSRGMNRFGDGYGAGASAVVMDPATPSSSLDGSSASHTRRHPSLHVQTSSPTSLNPSKSIPSASHHHQLQLQQQYQQLQQAMPQFQRQSISNPMSPNQLHQQQWNYMQQQHRGEMPPHPPQHHPSQQQHPLAPYAQYPTAISPTDSSLSNHPHSHLHQQQQQQQYTLNERTDRFGPRTNPYSHEWVQQQQQQQQLQLLQHQTQQQQQMQLFQQLQQHQLQYQQKQQQQQQSQGEKEGEEVAAVRSMMKRMSGAKESGLDPYSQGFDAGLKDGQPALSQAIGKKMPKEWFDHYLSLAHQRYNSGDFSKALEILQDLFASDPTHLPALLLLGCACHSLGLNDLSVLYNTLILNVDPRFAEAYSNLGTTHRAIAASFQRPSPAGGPIDVEKVKHHLGLAERYYRAAIGLRPRYWDATVNLAGLLSGGGRYAEAVKVYRGLVDRMEKVLFGQGGDGESGEKEKKDQPSLSPVKDLVKTRLSPPIASVKGREASPYRLKRDREDVEDDDEDDNDEVEEIGVDQTDVGGVVKGVSRMLSPGGRAAKRISPGPLAASGGVAASGATSDEDDDEDVTFVDAGNGSSECGSEGKAGFEKAVSPPVMAVKVAEDDNARVAPPPPTAAMAISAMTAAIPGGQERSGGIPPAGAVIGDAGDRELYEHLKKMEVGMVGKLWNALEMQAASTGASTIASASSVGVDGALVVKSEDRAVKKTRRVEGTLSTVSIAGSGGASASSILSSSLITALAEYTPERRRDLHYAMGNLLVAMGDAVGARREYYRALVAVRVDLGEIIGDGGVSSIRVREQGEPLPAASDANTVFNEEEEVRSDGRCSFPTPQKALGVWKEYAGRKEAKKGGSGEKPVVTRPPFSFGTRWKDSAAGRSRSELIQTWRMRLGRSAEVREGGKRSTTMILLDALESDVAGMYHPTTSAILQTLAKMAQDGGRVDLALGFYYLAVGFHPTANACNNLGILLASHRMDEAILWYELGLHMDRNHVHLYTNLGSALKDRGQVTEGIACYERAITLQPDFHIALANLANVRKDQGRVEDAIQLYKRALAAKPNFVEAFCNFVNSLLFVCDWANRSENLDKVREIIRGQLLAGIALAGEGGVRILGAERKGSGRLVRNGMLFDKVVRYVTKWGQSFPSGNMGIGGIRVRLNVDQGDMLGQAIAFTLGSAPLPPPRPLPTVLPFHTFTYPSLTCAMIREISRRNGDRVYHAVASSAWHPGSGLRPLAILERLLKSGVCAIENERGLSVGEPGDAARALLEQLRPYISKSAQYPYPFAPPKAFPDKICIGYVSSDFNDHPLSHLMRSVFAMHDRSRFVIRCYSLSAPAAASPATTAPASTSAAEADALSGPGGYREAIKRGADFFLDVSGWTVEKIARRVAEDGCHVLVDLNGYTRGGRGEIFASRPAPVQVAVMGYAGTMGTGRYYGMPMADQKGLLGKGSTFEEEEVEEDVEDVRRLVRGCKGQWIDYMVSDEIACPRHMVRNETSSVSVEGKEAVEENAMGVGLEEGPEDGRMYSESMIYMPRSFFVNDHRQGYREAEDPEVEAMIEKAAKTASFNKPLPPLPNFASARAGFASSQIASPTSPSTPLSPPPLYPSVDIGYMEESGLSASDLRKWRKEQVRRAKMRADLFPGVPADTVIFANFNQLYKIDPVIFDTWLRILARVPKSVLWLLRFPAAGESRLRKRALEVAGEAVANRIVFTDVAMKHAHILRGRAADMFLDTPECNAHTTAADILWSGTPLLTFPKYSFRMCSRVAASVAYATGSWDHWERDRLVAPLFDDGSEPAAPTVFKKDPTFPGIGLGTSVPAHQEGETGPSPKRLTDDKWLLGHEMVVGSYEEYEERAVAFESREAGGAGENSAAARVAAARAKTMGEAPSWLTPKRSPPEAHGAVLSTSLPLANAPSEDIVVFQAFYPTREKPIGVATPEQLATLPPQQQQQYMLYAKAEHEKREVRLQKQLERLALDRHGSFGIFWKDGTTFARMGARADGTVGAFEETVVFDEGCYSAFRHAWVGQVP
ncbi:hypothetical protein HDU97_000318 [Phlyctochytrium planicorne]|nr:hypothetical protein HDU97_000318 [Phlyctochytrium planicorne]